jgi:hypothetical protein
VSGGDDLDDIDDFDHDLHCPAPFPDARACRSTAMMTQPREYRKPELQSIAHPDDRSRRIRCRAAGVPPMGASARTSTLTFEEASMQIEVLDVVEVLPTCHA